MGSAIARRLIECGHGVSVFNRSAKKTVPLVALGARGAVSAADAARGSEFVITCLNSAAIVEEATLGQGGAAEAMDAGSLLIDMSSIDPASTQRLAGAMRERCGADWVDAPLSGGAPKALLGQLTVMAGGTSEAVQRAREVMRDLCANYTHMGPSGAGQATKLVNQVLCALNNQAVAEAVRLAESCGVDASVLPAALAGGRADSAALREFAPQMAARRVPPSGSIVNMLKDLEGVQRVAHGARLPLPLTATVAELFRGMVAAGIGDEQMAAIIRQFDGYKALAAA
ncbi:MAG: NAD(P)-dependent oxidoreductase [Proteobacteria bacterium]|nr:NAD(P)-dependent oxidoreductase [Pseudomonadota bacterium]